MTRACSRRVWLATSGALVTSSWLGTAHADDEPPVHKDGDAALRYLRKHKPIDRSVAQRYRFETPNNDVQSGGAIIAVNKPLTDVLKVVTTFRKYKHILPRLEQSRIVDKKPGKHTDLYVRAPVLGGTFHVWGVVRLSDPKRWRSRGKQVVGKLHKGNLEAWHNVWKMHHCGPKRTILRLEIYAELSIPVPASVVTAELEWAADRGVTAVRDIAECGRSSVRKNAKQ